MDSVFQELKQAREAKSLSIGDVSDATLINAHFLEAIEQGNITILPQPYVRAFIREYAGFVGLDPVEIMRRYDQMKDALESPPEAEGPPAIHPAPPPEEKKSPDQPTAASAAPVTPTIARFALPAILILTLGIVVWNLTRSKAPGVSEKTPPANTIQESVIDSTAKQTVAGQKSATLISPDSLTLHATISDTVWVQIVIDNMEPQQYMFRPGRKITWKAKENFRLTTGNAGTIDLVLNDKHLGPVGKRGAVVRNLDINRKTLQQK